MDNKETYSAPTQAGGEFKNKPINTKKWMLDYLYDGDVPCSAFINLVSKATREKVVDEICEKFFENINSIKNYSDYYNTIVFFSPTPGFIKRPSNIQEIMDEFCSSNDLLYELMIAIEKDGGNPKKILSRIYENEDDMPEIIKEFETYKFKT